MAVGIGPDLHVLNARTLSVEKITAEAGTKSMGGAKPKLFNRGHQAYPELALAEAEKLVTSGPIIIARPLRELGPACPEPTWPQKQLHIGHRTLRWDSDHFLRFEVRLSTPPQQ